MIPPRRSSLPGTRGAAPTPRPEPSPSSEAPEKPMQDVDPDATIPYEDATPTQPPPGDEDTQPHDFTTGSGGDSQAAQPTPSVPAMDDSQAVSEEYFYF